MKKLLAFILIVSIASCKKKAETPNYHFTFTVDGVNKSFSGFIDAYIDTANREIFLNIEGSNNNPSTDFLDIELENYPAFMSITPGLYKDSSNNYSVISSYAVNNKLSYSGQAIYHNAVVNNITLAHPFVLSITSMDKTSIQGTFSGDYYEGYDIKTASKKYITNGDFYVPFK